MIAFLTKIVIFSYLVIMEKKICIYTIAKNEIKFVDRWVESAKEADYMCVLDTGSTDGTVERLKELGVKVEQKKYKNFRFDKARNDSLELIPDDAEICVSVDMDEFFEKGWAQILKDNWADNVGRARYRYTWNFNPDGSEGIVFMADKVHKNKYYEWVNPVHEILVPKKETNLITIDLPQVRLYHKADNSKSRGSYLPLLELSIQEDPTNDRNMHYLGREYMFHGMYDKAIETLNRHLKMPSATWKDERSSSYRFIAFCYKQKGDNEKQEEYLLKSLLEADHIRESYYELGEFYFEKNDYLKSAVFFNQMLKIDSRYLSYMSAPKCWGSLPYDYLSMCYYYLGDYEKALQNVNEALKFEKSERLLSNKSIFEKLFKNKNNI